MTNPNASILRILTLSGTVVGVGALIGEREVVTCAHVINAALERDPRDQDVPADIIELSFPLIANAMRRQARIIRWFPPTPSGVAGDDLAVLQLIDALPRGAAPVSIDPTAPSSGRVVDVFGYPGVPPRPDGAWVAAVVRGLVGGGRLQLDGGEGSALRVQPGFSGSPVIDRASGGFIGLLVAAPQGRSGDRDSYAISASRIRTLLTTGSGSPIRVRVPVSATLVGHTDAVISVAFSGDGTTLATGGADGTVRLWDTGTGAAVDTFSDHSSAVSSVAFLLDGGLLASGCADGSVQLWNLVICAGYTVTADSDAWSRSFIPGEDGTASISTFQGSTAGVWSVAFSPNGTTFAIGLRDGSVLVRDIAIDSSLVLADQTDEALSVAFSPDGKTVALCGRDGIPRMRHISVDNTGASDSSACLWAASAAALGGSVAVFTRSVNSVAFSPDGKVLASGGADGTVRLWNMTTGGLTDTFTDHASAINTLAFSPDGTILASGSDDNTVRLRSLW
ncbi:WD40 repeat domain-containing protein [Streptacidiphilus albus]|uniref:WD40 repeat domain-containing protein n=1 Tax=Streptacidiphilus albus TaxID=105425 RepID=UPI00054C689F|nr:trypsin-like peptidase domain-containing protein [Streptacidiphilus albus]